MKLNRNFFVAATWSGAKDSGRSGIYVSHMTTQGSLTTHLVASAH